MAGLLVSLGGTNSGVCLTSADLSPCSESHQAVILHLTSPIKRLTVVDCPQKTDYLGGQTLRGEAGLGVLCPRLGIGQASDGHS